MPLPSGFIVQTLGSSANTPRDASSSRISTATTSSAAKRKCVAFPRRPPGDAGHTIDVPFFGDRGFKRIISDRLGNPLAEQCALVGLQVAIDIGRQKQ